MTQTVKLQGNDVLVYGALLRAGEKAVPFKLVANDLSDVQLTKFAGKRKILNIFPSVDTGVCAAS